MQDYKSQWQNSETTNPYAYTPQPDTPQLYTQQTYTPPSYAYTPQQYTPEAYAAAQAYTNNYQYQTQTYLATHSHSYPAPNIKSHMGWAIVATIWGCLPTGIVAIVYASKVNTMLAIRDYKGAAHASRMAKLWLFITLLVVILSVIVIFILAAKGYDIYGLRSY